MQALYQLTGLHATPEAHGGMVYAHGPTGLVFTIGPPAGSSTEEDSGPIASHELAFVPIHLGKAAEVWYSLSSAFLMMSPGLEYWVGSWDSFQGRRPTYCLMTDEEAHLSPFFLLFKRRPMTILSPAIRLIVLAQ